MYRSCFPLQIYFSHFYFHVSRRFNCHLACWNVHRWKFHSFNLGIYSCACENWENFPHVKFTTIWWLQETTKSVIFEFVDHLCSCSKKMSWWLCPHMKQESKISTFRYGLQAKQNVHFATIKLWNIFDNICHQAQHCHKDPHTWLTSTYQWYLNFVFVLIKVVQVNKDPPLCHQLSPPTWFLFKVINPLFLLNSLVQVLFCDLFDLKSSFTIKNNEIALEIRYYVHVV